jgi:hypothetical protein
MSGTGDYYDKQEKSSIEYKREGDTVWIAIRGMTNWEMRDFIVGMWLRLDLDDRIDHIKALQHYLEPGSIPPYVSRTLAASPDQPQMRRKPS